MHAQLKGGESGAIFTHGILFNMYHLAARKRGKKKTEPFPARTFWMRFLDTMVIVAGVVGPLMTIPQMVLIYGNHTAGAVSPFTWFGYAVLDVPWIIYGIAHREWPIISTYWLWLAMNLAVAIGAVLYS
jgi:uncharacterized protein with PQ loop repeat